MPEDVGVKVDKSVEVRRSPMELYHFWHQLTNLPEIMPHVVSVTVEDSRSHWVVAGPLGKQVEWDAEFINEKPGELIAWQSLPGSDVQSAGSVRFEPIGDGQSTRVRVVLEYLPPAGKAGAFLAHLLGSAPDQQLETDLWRFKERMESGQVRAPKERREIVAAASPPPMGQPRRWGHRRYSNAFLPRCALDKSYR